EPGRNWHRDRSGRPCLHRSGGDAAGGIRPGCGGLALPGNAPGHCRGTRRRRAVCPGPHRPSAVCRAWTGVPGCPAVSARRDVRTGVMAEEFLIDWDRLRRTGVTEAVLCEPKTPAQIDAIVASAAGRRLLLTRLDEARHAALAERTQSALAYDPLSGTAVLGGSVSLTETGVGIVAAGTSDLRVA